MIHYTNELTHHGIKGQKWGVRKESSVYAHSDNKHIVKKKGRSTLHGMSKNKLGKVNIREYIDKTDAKIKDLITANNIKMVGIGKHFAQRQFERRVKTKDAKSALTNPMNISNVKVDKSNRKSQRFTGDKATVVINPGEKTAITTWKTGRKTKKRYSK